MKDVGFIALLKDREYNPRSVGFMKDDQGRRGVSCNITVANNKKYAVWFMQKDFPTGIYVIAITKMVACVIWPVYALYEGRDMFALIDFVDNLKDGVDESDPIKFTHPWTELSERILKV